MDVIKLKEMISTCKISLCELSESELRAVIEYESARIDDEDADLEFLNECFAAMARLCPCDSVITEKELHSMAKKAMRTPRGAGKRLPRKKLFAILIAAALLVSILSVTAIAFGEGPLAKFFDNIHDIIDLKPGDMITNGNNDLTLNANTVYYDTVEHAENAMDVTLLLPAERSACHFTQIYSCLQAPDMEPVIYLFYTYHGHRVSQANLLGSSYEQEKNFIAHKDEMEHIVIDGRTYYFAESGSYFSIFMFADGVYYNISVDSRGAAMDLLGIE